MKSLIPLLSILLFLALGCEKADFRDEVTGNYTGIRVHSYMMEDSTGNWVTIWDTTSAEALITKSAKESSLDLYLNQGLSSSPYTFEYYRNQRIYIGQHMDLLLGPDTLYILFTAGRGPDWVEYFLKKGK